MATKFSSLNLSELKQELKKRNAKQSGRKKELIERLEAYERNSNFGNTDRPLQPEYNMKVPDPMLYLDLNSDKKLPCITKTGIEFYLNAFDKSMDSTPVGLYKEKHLCYMRVCFSDESSFVKSTCRAEMKKSVTYGIDIRLCVDGEVQEAQCECGAGMGPTAHCKHVCTVLYAGYMFGKSGSVVVENTCTDELQSFHRVKKHTGSPVKTCDLQLDGADESTNVNFDPRPAKFRNCEGYSDYFRNTCLNFKGVSSMPVF